MENIKIMVIIEAKMGQNEIRSKCATLKKKKFRYRYSNQIMIYADCNRILQLKA